MKSKPLVSLIGSGIRVDLWQNLHKNLSNNDVSFEIVLVGDVRPGFKLPENFRYIHSQVKPSQCFEIAARSAKGELIVIIADDLLFSNGFLDNLYKTYSNECTERDFVSGLFKRHGEFYDNESYKFWPKVEHSPRLPICPMLSTNLWHDIGGVDINFIALFWDLDLVLRMFENGGNGYICSTAFCEEIFQEKSLYSKLLEKIYSRKVLQSSLYQEFGVKMDRPKLDSFWTKVVTCELSDKDYYAVKNNVMHMKKRMFEPVRIQDKDIINFSQGPKGRWR